MIVLCKLSVFECVREKLSGCSLVLSGLVDILFLISINQTTVSAQGEIEIYAYTVVSLKLTARRLPVVETI